MTTIVYTAVRALTGLTAANGTATLEIGLSDYSRSRTAVRDVQRSMGGARETLYHRADVIHNMTFQPVNGFEKKQLREFLASTESGQTFNIYIYGDESLPVSVVREDDTWTESMFMNIGSDDRDYVQASITVMEV